MSDGMSDIDGGRGGEVPDLCPVGCYWECEHRAASSSGGGAGVTSGGGGAGAGAGLFTVEDTLGRPLQRCRDCGDFFYSVVEHARDHEQLRQLGWLPDDPLPQPFAAPEFRERRRS